jgi:hypothetical protein
MFNKPCTLKQGGISANFASATLKGLPQVDSQHAIGQNEILPLCHGQSARLGEGWL